MEFDLGTSVRERVRMRGHDPMGFDAPRASRYLFGIDDALLGGLVGGGLGIFGNLLGASGGKGRANEFQKRFNEQKEYQRGRFGETEAMGDAGMLGALTRARSSLGRDFSAVGAARDNAMRQLNRASGAYQDRVGQVQSAINQVGQTARADIMDQGKQSGAATAANLQRRGLGSSTMLAGAQAQNQQATGRSLSALNEGIAGVRAGALERTTGDVADFMKFRAQYEPGLALAGREITRAGENRIGDLIQGKTMFQTGLRDSHTSADSNLLMNLINAAVGGKGVMTGAAGNAIGGIGNILGTLLSSGAFSN